MELLMALAMLLTSSEGREEKEKDVSIVIWSANNFGQLIYTSFWVAVSNELFVFCFYDVKLSFPPKAF